MGVNVSERLVPWTAQIYATIKGHETEDLAVYVQDNTEDEGRVIFFLYDRKQLLEALASIPPEEVPHLADLIKIMSNKASEGKHWVFLNSREIYGCVPFNTRGYMESMN